MYYVGIDVGGTFTDCVAVNEEGKYVVTKSPTTHGRLLEGIRKAIISAAEIFGVSPEELFNNIGHLCNGTTVSTNTLLSRTGAKLGLITTKGHRDALLMMRVGRLTHPPKFGLLFDRPEPLVPRRFIKEVSERMDYRGRVVTHLDLDDVQQVVDELVRDGVTAVAVCLLWSFANPQHEVKIKEYIERNHPGIHITLSSELAPFIGEYERTSTCVVNSYVSIQLQSYLNRFAEVLNVQGVKVSPFIMQATGGLLPFTLAMDNPITTINSGPVGGAIACRELGRSLGIKDLMGIDMGGTSFDINLIVDGETTVSLASKFAGYDIALPFVDVYSIGAGGGSIAKVDVAGRLKVGPKSAESCPGPACYALGGTEATVTDADVVLGFINPDYYLGGKFALNKDLALQAVEENIGKPLGMTAEKAAKGIFDVVNNQMVDAMRTRTIEKGLDPREFTMVSFGGCGSTHAAFLAAELGIKQVVVPSTDTAFSAYGVLGADILKSFSITDVFETPFDKSAVNKIFEQLDQEGRSLMTANGVEEDILTFKHFMELRYRGQFYSLEIPVSQDIETEEVLEDFERLYEKLYGSGTRYREAGIIATRLRSDCIGRVMRPRDLSGFSNGNGKGTALPCGQRKVFLGAWVDFNVYRFEELPRGVALSGPMIVEKKGSTVVIPPGDTVRLDDQDNLLIRINKQ